MHCGLGSATLSQLAFPGEVKPEFPMGEIPLEQYSCKMYQQQQQQQSLGGQIRKQTKLFFPSIYDLNNNNNNGDLFSALTKISTTRFTIAMYK